MNIPPLHFFVYRILHSSFWSPPIYFQLHICITCPNQDILFDLFYFYQIHSPFCTFLFLTWPFLVFSNFKTDLKEIHWEGVDWIYLSQDQDYGNKPSGSMKGEGLLTSQVLPSQEGLCSMELVS